MNRKTGPSLRSVALANAVDAFEAELAVNPATELEAFLPPRGDSQFEAILLELVKVDLHRTGPQHRLQTLLTRYPQLGQNPKTLAEIAYEDFRCRSNAGEQVRPTVYAAQYRIDVSQWPEPDLASTASLQLTQRMPNDPPLDHQEHLLTEEVGRMLRETDQLPAIGDVYLGFKLVGELGRGAFGRVYLAEQSSLGHRLVALKVATRGDADAESVTLAQLQHSNIVPIYSFHREGTLQAVCMPFFGATTLARIVDTLRSTNSLPVSGRELRSLAPPTVVNDESSANSDNSPAATPEVSLERLVPEGWRRLDNLSYVEAILTLGAQLAEGLSHAHHRGILHCDMKPANVLLADDGRPMLLDFNLAADVRQQGRAERAAVGGTLQYMSPEHLRAFRDRGGTLDARCDVYSLGVILFELLTGQHPFPSRKGHMGDRIALMLEDRMKVPRLMPLNSAISPCVEAIIRKCLAPNPADRYLVAEHLQEDLERQLRHLPLKYAGNPSLRESFRKWRRRHPHLASTGSVATIAACMLLALAAGAYAMNERSKGFKAKATYADHQASFAATQLFIDDRKQSRADFQLTQQKLRSQLDRYGVNIENPDSRWQENSDYRRLDPPDQERLRADLGEVFFFLAQNAVLESIARRDTAGLDRAKRWNAASEQYAAERLPRALADQKATIAEMMQDADAAELRQRADVVKAVSARDMFLQFSTYIQRGRHLEALPSLIRATNIDPGNFSAWFVRGVSHAKLKQHDQAAMCFGACLALRSDFAPAWMNRGVTLLHLGENQQARTDLDRAAELDPHLPQLYIFRGDLEKLTGNLEAAEREFTRGLEMPGAPTRLYFLRSHLRALRGDQSGSRDDQAIGLRLPPNDELSWVARAEIVVNSDPKAALEQINQALEMYPFSAEALRLKASIQGEDLNLPDDALLTLNRGIELYPDDSKLRAGRAVQLARFGKRNEALIDAIHAERVDSSASICYQLAGVYALTSKTHPEDKQKALSLLWLALKSNFGFEFVKDDPDLDSLRKDQQFLELMEQANNLKRARDAVNNQERKNPLRN